MSTPDELYLASLGIAQPLAERTRFEMPPFGVPYCEVAILIAASIHYGSSGTYLPVKE